MTATTDSCIVLDAPMELVWEMTNDITSWPTLFTEYASAEILDRTGSTIRFRLTMHPDPDGTTHSWVSERTPDPATRTVRARRIETGPFDFMDIFWQYREVPGGVEMRWVQKFKVRDEMPFDDQAMVQHLTQNTTVQMAHIKKQVEAAARERVA